MFAVYEHKFLETGVSWGLEEDSGHIEGYSRVPFQGRHPSMSSFQDRTHQVRSSWGVPFQRRDTALLCLKFDESSWFIVCVLSILKLTRQSLILLSVFISISQKIIT